MSTKSCLTELVIQVYTLWSSDYHTIVRKSLDTNCVDQHCISIVSKQQKTELSWLAPLDPVLRPFFALVQACPQAAARRTKARPRAVLVLVRVQVRQTKKSAPSQ